MLDEIIARRLVAATDDRPEVPIKMRTGKITAVFKTPNYQCSAIMTGSTITLGGIAILGQYFPQVDDIAVFLQHGNQLIALECLNSRPWLDYVPTLTNVTLGNGTLFARYKAYRDRVDCHGSITLGSTTSVTGTIGISLPTSVRSGGVFLGAVKAEDSSAGYVRTVGIAEISGSSLTFSSDGNAGWQATVPFTWGTNDVLAWQISYEPA